MRNYFRVPEALVEEWPEVFDEDMLISTMPISYLRMFQIEFKDGRVWEFNIQEHLKKTDASLLSKKLIETLREYRDSIKKVDFKLDIEKLKHDVSKSTKNLL